MVCRKCGERNAKTSNFCRLCGAKLVNKVAKRGFASMDRAKRKKISQLGGFMAHKLGKADTWTSEEARAAGRIGGRFGRRTTTNG